MATQYINNNKEIVFLNNKNIAHERGNLEDNTIAYNAIPSLSLFNNTYNEVTGYTNNVEISAYGISCTVSSLSAAISNEVSSAEQRAYSYTEQLSGEFKDISAILHGAVTILDQDDHEIGHDLSVRKMSNDAYDQLVRTGGVSDNEIYIIHDDYYSARGQKIKNLADPIELSDATNKWYVDSTLSDLSTLTYNEASSYSNSTSAYALETANANANSSFACYDNARFDYEGNKHELSLTFYNKEGVSHSIKFDASQIVRNRMIQNMEITKNADNVEVLRIYWDQSTGSQDFIDIKLDGLIPLYTADTDLGISIYLKSDNSGYALSCTDVIARTAALNGVAERVGTLETNTGKIQTYINLLSTENTGILAGINTRIQEYKGTTEACTASLQELTGTGGTVTDLQNRVTAIETGYISKAALQACFIPLTSDNPTFNEVVQTLRSIQGLF